MEGRSHESLYLVETSERIIIHPTTFHAGDKFVVINRITDEISISTDDRLVSDQNRLKTISICGVLGVIRLVAGPYLVVITSRENVGTLAAAADGSPQNGHAIWRMKQCEMIPFRKSLLHLTEKQIQFNSTYLDMLRTVVDTPYFYYSNTYDLSHTMQSLDSNSPDFLKQTLVERAEERFVWNKAMLDNFHRGSSELQAFCVPIIHGFASITAIQLKTQQVKFILISRRSSRRPGTRLFSRGIDEEGNVSNFVETEQIIECGAAMTSYVQVRGSVPLFWTQRPNLKYKPKPTVAPLNHSEAYTKHFHDLMLRYGRVTSVNLVNHTGSESTLEIGFRDQHSNLADQNTGYEAFDFHHECRNMNYQRLEVLVNRLSGDLEEFGYYIRGSGQQEGVFRTNCVDCLDRTNALQSLLAKANAEMVLKRMTIFGDGEKVRDHPDFEYLFKNVWADNGDIVSIEYSGTGALKADFTRTGKRTVVGLMRDGYNACIRYVKNNFADGFRQDAMDLFVGNYIVSEKEGSLIRCPLEKNRDWKYLTLPILLIMSLVMFLSVIIFPQENTTETLMYMLFWGSMSVACGGVILYFGQEFVDNPVLTSAFPLTM